MILNCEYFYVISLSIYFHLYYNSLQYYYYAKTARIIVQNVQGFGELSRRKGQDIIQTWHASNGYKKQGQYIGIKRKLELLYHKDYSYVLSGSESMTKRRIRGTMGFEGEVIKGTPRMDMIIQNNDKQLLDNVRKRLNIREKAKILLYAPTWRNDRYKNDYGLEYDKVIELFEKKYGGNWILVIRFHPNVYSKHDITKENIIDATHYPDMQELLCVADALISDYSSCIWDFSFSVKPCFLYCTDIEQFGNDRDFDIPISRWGFPVAKNMEELKDIINHYDENDFLKSIRFHHLDMGNYEDGNATERVCNLINTLCGGK